MGERFRGGKVRGVLSLNAQTVRLGRGGFFVVIPSSVAGRRRRRPLLAGANPLGRSAAVSSICRVSVRRPADFAFASVESLDGVDNLES